MSSRARAGVTAALLGAAMVWPAGQARAAEEIPAPARSWKYIVIHHSATAFGSASVFDAHHRARGMVNGLAYHFVINNGTNGTSDGQIESGARWVKQLHGGHCKQDDINNQGIGICLVGDFTEDQPTTEQLQALRLLIDGLQHQFGITDDNIVGHGQILGEYSQCPGRSFPWTALREKPAR